MRLPDPILRLSGLDPKARAQLYRLLSEADAVRADAIRQLHARPGTQGLAEVLIDVEADPVLRLEILRLLRDASASGVQ